MQAVSQPDGSFEPACLLGSVVATRAMTVSCDHGTRQVEGATSAPRVKDGDAIRGRVCPRSTNSIAKTREIDGLVGEMRAMETSEGG